MYRCFVMVMLIFMFPSSTRCVSPLLDNLWMEFKSKYNKTYNILQETLRRIAWEENLLKINLHNAEAANGLHNYTLRSNHLSDLSLRDYLREMVRLTKSRRREQESEPIVGLSMGIDIPDEEDRLNFLFVLHAEYEALCGIDYETISDFTHIRCGGRFHVFNWRERGFYTPAWNQEDCGSCYAFAISTAVEAQLFKKTNQLVDLSEQQIIDCSTRSGNLGCRGGSLRYTLRYVHTYGLMKANDYPYVAEDGKCQYSPLKAVTRISRWNVLPPRDEESLKIALALIGPIAVSINASPRTFQFYHNGIYDDIDCSSNALNHAMLLIGYTKKAWILKNWWSEEWGQKGYMFLVRGHNRCGVANYAAYAEI